MLNSNQDKLIELDKKTSELFLKLILQLAKKDAESATFNHYSGLVANIQIEYPSEAIH